MFFSVRIPMLRSKRIQSVLSGILLCAFGISCFGVPVAHITSKDTSRPFPCMHRACGCMSADACWRSCCCHTNQQKLAWAKQHGVQPPSYVVAAAAKEAGASRSCCSAGKSCCDKPAAPQPCATAKSCCDAASDELTSDEPTLRLSWASIAAYDKCRGKTSTWLSIGHAINVSPLPLSVAPTTTSEPIFLTRQSLISLAYAPAVPPPRSVAL